MTAYEAAVQEKDQLYARIQLVREEIKQEQDPGRRGEQKGRLRILFEMYHESLDRLDALRPPQEKRHKAVKRTVIHTGAAGADVNSFDFFERCGVTFADLEGNQVRWDDLGSDNGESRARLMRALRRGRAAVSDRQREMLDLLLQGKTATEIAEQLDVNKATVSRTLLRAKKALNDKAEDLRQEDLREHPNRLDLAAPETARYVLSRLTETQAVYLYLYYGEWLDRRTAGRGPFDRLPHDPSRGRPHPCPLHRRQRRGAAGRGRARAGAVCALPAARSGRSDPGAGQSRGTQGDRLRSPEAAGADAGSHADNGADMGPAKAPRSGAEPSPACVGRRGGSAYRLAPRAPTRAPASLPRENNKSRLTIRRGRALQLSHGHSERSRTQEAAPAEQPTNVQRTPVFNPRLPIPSSRDFVSAG